MLWLIGIFLVTYALIASEKVDKSIAAVLGASAVILFGFISYEDALDCVDLNVLFLLIGMMMVVNTFARTGVFEWIAISIAQKARGNGMVILVSFLLVTAGISAFLDNVTTVLLIAPLTILVTQILELPTVPFLILEAVFSNIGGTATLVGDPPNVIIASRAGLTFNEFICHLTPIVVIVTIVSIAAVIITYRRSTATSEQVRARVRNADPRLAITDKRRLKWALAVFGLILAGFFTGRVLNIEPGIVALAGGFLMALVCRVEAHKLLERVEWVTILFFVGLFMLVGALERNGVFEIVGKGIIQATQGNLLLAVLAVLWGCAIVTALVNNIPLVIAMIPIIESTVPVFASKMGLEGNPEMTRKLVEEPLLWALALGACLGGNGTLVSATANLVVAQVAQKNRYHLSFWMFTKLGLPMAVLSLVLSSLYLWVRYFLLRGSVI